MYKSFELKRLILLFLLCTTLAAAFSTPACAANGHYWQDVRATVSIHSLATNGSVYVAGGGGRYGNGLWISTDLKSWKRADLPAPVGPHISSVTYQNGRFIAVGNTIVTSSDGVHWSVADVPLKLTGSYSAITYAKDLYVVVGQSNQLKAAVLTSTDGTSWASQPAGVPEPPADGETLLDGVAWNGARFVAMGTIVAKSGNTDVIITSNDAENWTQAALPAEGAASASFGNNYNDVLAYGNGTFVAGGGIDLTTFSSGLVYTSVDGLQWSAHPLPNNFAVSGLQFVNGVFIAPATIFRAAPAKTGYLMSTDGINWTFGSVDPQEKELGLAAFLYAGGRYITGGQAGVWTSPDLTTWTKLFVGPQTNDMRCSDYGENIGYILLGSLSDKVLISPDGIDWPADVTPISSQIAYTHNAAYSDGCIASGPAGYVSNGFYSADGVNWHAAAVPTNEDIRLVAHNSAKYLAVAQNSANSLGDFDVLVNTDGKTWTRIADDLPNIPFPSALQVINNSFFLIGQNGQPGWEILKSSGGANWTDVTPPVAAGGFPHIGYGNGILIAMWNDDDGNLKIAHSKDGGTTWKIEANAFLEGLAFEPASIAYGDGVYIAVGHESQHTDGYPVDGFGSYLVSSDGIHWTYAIDNRIGPFNTLLWDGSRFLATSETDILASAGDIPSVLLNIITAGPATVEPENQFAITLIISNNGNVRANGVIVEDSLPDSATLSSVTPSQGTCDTSDATVSCTLNMLKIGATATVTLKVTAGSAEGKLTNQASVHASQPVAHGANSDSTSTVNVRKPEDTGGGSGSSDGGGSSSSGGGGTLGLLGIASLLSLAWQRRRKDNQDSTG